MISTRSTSPGRAPSMAMGPLIGLTREKSRFTTASTPSPGWIWSLPASRVWIVTGSFSRTVSTGARLLSHTCRY